jgi:hypothetical protein
MWLISFSMITNVTSQNWKKETQVLGIVEKALSTSKILWKQFHNF